MQDMVAINILVGDRTYRIRILPKDEETVRKTVKLINDKLIEFKTSFAGKDMQDYVAMVLLWYATQPQPTEETSLSATGILATMQTIEQQLDRVL